MNTQTKTPSTAPTASLDASSKTPRAEPKRVRLPDSFKRILVRKTEADRYTTVSVGPEQYAAALRLTHGCAGQVNATLRTAALEVNTEVPAAFSAAVRKKALSKLRGSYRPKAEPKAKVLPEVAARLAAENNQVWAQSEDGEDGNGGMQ